MSRPGEDVNLLFLAARVHWKPGVVVALVATSLLTGLALAHSSGLERARRAAGVCGNARLVQRQVAGRLAVGQHARRSCHGRSPWRRGVAKRVAVEILSSRLTSGPDASQPPNPPANSATPAATEPPPPPPDTTPPQTSITGGPAATEPPPPPPPPPDTTPPQTSITGGPAANTTSTSATFSFTSNEAGSSFECELDGAGWAACVSPKTFSGVPVGSHQFSVRAIDPAKNVDPTPATQKWTVESPPPPPPPPPPPAECSTVVTSVAAAESAVAAATVGSVVCLADGSYGEVSLSASKSAEVTLQAEHPGRATIAGAILDGSHLTLARFDITNEVTVQPGSSAMTIEYNRITGGYMGINAGPTSDTSISDTTIRGNQLVGPFGEDALRINRYHDSADPDPYGILIEGNEISGVRENGNHSDCLQSVWGGDSLYFRRNYLHDNRCQGFFVKDQPSMIVGINLEDNLFLRNSEPCAAGAAGCGQPSYLQIFGPYEDFTMRRNTVWQGEVVAAFQEGAGPGTTIESNVVNRFWTNTNLSGIAYTDNTRCKREASGGSWPTQAPGETVDCAPAFNDPAADDFRLIGSERGVDWAPAEEHFGP
jgi:hypothetical protein